MWCTFSRTHDLYKSLPSFYFEISGNGFDYGCGYYIAATESMNDLRSLILNDSPYFTAALEAFEAQSTFDLYGDMYKRDRYPAESDTKKNWLNRKTIGISARSKDWELLFSDRLADKIAADFESVAPIYDLFLKAEEFSAENK